jgi:hypothetical protein
VLVGCGAHHSWCCDLYFLAGLFNPHTSLLLGCTEILSSRFSVL